MRCWPRTGLPPGASSRRAFSENLERERHCETRPLAKGASGQRPKGLRCLGGRGLLGISSRLRLSLHLVPDQDRLILAMQAHSLVLNPRLSEPRFCIGRKDLNDRTEL